MLFELLDDLTDKDDYKLGDSVELTLPQMHVGVLLAIEGKEAHVDETFDLELSEEVAVRPALYWLLTLSTDLAGQDLVCILVPVDVSPLSSLILARLHVD